MPRCRQGLHRKCTGGGDCDRFGAASMKLRYFLEPISIRPERHEVIYASCACRSSAGSAGRSRRPFLKPEENADQLPMGVGGWNETIYMVWCDCRRLWNGPHVAL